MAFYVLVPALIFAACSTLTWACAKYSEVAQTQRTASAHLPRSRPYAQTLPKHLLGR